MELLYTIYGRTKNCCVEGWHNKINRAAGKAHPKVFELVELFKGEQANTEVSLAQLAAGGEADEKEVRYVGEYTLDEYVDNVSKWMGIRR